MIEKYWEIGGGQIRNTSALYVERLADSQLRESLIDQHGFVILTGSRQTGKSSLAGQLVNWKGKPENLPGWLTVFFDFREYPKVALDSEEWFSHFFINVALQLNITENITLEWYERNKNKTYTARLVKDFWETFVRQDCGISEPILLILDELDQIMIHGYHIDDFLTGIMMTMETKHELKLSILTLSIIHPKHFLHLRKKSALKNGRSIFLPDFEPNQNTLDQWGEPFNVTLEKRREIIEEIFRFTHGHPYLTVQICHEFYEANSTDTQHVQDIVDAFIKNQKHPITQDPHFDAPGEFIKERERFAIKALKEYERILSNQAQPFDQMNNDLRNVLLISGLIRVKGNEVFIRNPIYRKVFDEHWVQLIQGSVGSKESWAAPTKSIYQRKSATRRKRICLINTGGTIGMMEQGGQMVPPSSNREWTDTYPMLKELVELEQVPLKSGPRDGANIYPEDWATIAKLIFDRRNDGYEGFVISHGTDTMAYTASAVAFALGKGLPFPVVFVGSQAPNNVLYGDAFVNMNRAAKIATMDIPEVVICYNDKVMRAVRAEKKDDYHFDGFHSPTYSPIATITERIIISPHWKEEIANRHDFEFKLENQFDDHIIPIVQHPGLRPDYFKKLVHQIIEDDQLPPISAVLIQSLGLGNLPTSGVRYNFLDTISTLTEMGIPVLITSKYPILEEFAVKYSPARAILGAGAISAGNMISSAAYCKLSWLLPQINAGIKNGDIKPKDKLVELEYRIKRNYIGELDKILDESHKHNRLATRSN